MIQREQAPAKLMDRRAKTECQSREELGPTSEKRLTPLPLIFTFVRFHSFSSVNSGRFFACDPIHWHQGCVLSLIPALTSKRAMFQL